jgi:hypothetical protein
MYSHVVMAIVTVAVAAGAGWVMPRKAVAQTAGAQGGTAKPAVNPRATAKAGDIFGTDMTPLILEIVRADWKRRPAVDRAAILAGMEKPFVPTVNMRYPVGQPLMTFPPTLLRQLQELPEDLEYRFVGRDLILRDVKANMVVDVIRHAIPSTRPS